MKNFSIQRLGLVMMLMLSVMVSTAPLPKEEEARQLKLIRAKAQHMIDHLSSDKKAQTVTKVSGSDQQCVDKFFCLAEKSLEALNHTENAPHTLPTLIRLLQKYNNMTRDVNCNLTNGISQKLRLFLEDIKECVDYALQNKTTT